MRQEDGRDWRSPRARSPWHSRRPLSPRTFPLAWIGGPAKCLISCVPLPALSCSVGTTSATLEACPALCLFAVRNALVHVEREAPGEWLKQVLPGTTREQGWSRCPRRASEVRVAQACGFIGPGWLDVPSVRFWRDGERAVSLVKLCAFIQAGMRSPEFPSTLTDGNRGARPPWPRGSRGRRAFHPDA